MATREQTEELARQADAALRLARMTGKEVDAQIVVRPNGQVVTTAVFNDPRPSTPSKSRGEQSESQQS